MENTQIKIYTDGSCHTQLEIGAWAAIVFLGDKKVVLKDLELNTTHNRMEMIAVIRAIEHGLVSLQGPKAFAVYSDSQYVVNITSRKERLKKNKFITSKGTLIQNSDLVMRLIDLIESQDIEFIKVKAHQKNGDAINREVDILVRQMVREKVAEHGG